jgi:23S rRNA (pseudouridine1915-N3)-methyltransferase
MYTIIAPYDSLKHFEVAILEYTKRLAKKCEIIQLKPSKKDSIEEAKKEDTKHIIQKLEKISGYKILLDIEGKTFSTLDFFKFMGKNKQNNGNIIFIIGGVYGYTPELYKYIDFKFSLSPLTFPHNLALLSLLEQLYRIETVQQGKQYHY